MHRTVGIGELKVFCFFFFKWLLGLEGLSRQVMMDRR